MSWFPWAPAPVRSNMTTGELIDWIRYRAIDFGMPPQFIDCVDDLHSLDGLETENEELKAELETVQSSRDELVDRYKVVKKIWKAKRRIK
jgi:hypothetical protein